MLIFWSWRWSLVLCLAKDYVITSWVTLFNAKSYYYSFWAKNHYRFFAIRCGMNIWGRSCKIFSSLLPIKSQTQIIAKYQYVDMKKYTVVLWSAIYKGKPENPTETVYISFTLMPLRKGPKYNSPSTSSYPQSSWWKMTK